MRGITLLVESERISQKVVFPFAVLRTSSLRMMSIEGAPSFRKTLVSTGQRMTNP